MTTDTAAALEAARRYLLLCEKKDLTHDEIMEMLDIQKHFSPVFARALLASPPAPSAAQDGARLLCPFCESEAVRPIEYAKFGRFACTVICDDCESLGPHEATLTEAIAAYRRALPPAPAPGQVEAMEKALIDAAEHFQRIGDKALHWQKVTARNEFAEARWSGIKAWAWHRARECRAALASPEPRQEQTDV